MADQKKFLCSRFHIIYGHTPVLILLKVVIRENCLFIKNECINQMNNKKKPDVDVIMDILKETLIANPAAAFVESLLFQYQERGGLSKKQLEGLYNKATKVKTILPGKMATLEAIILRKHSKHKSELPALTPLYVKDEEAGKMLNAILDKYPEHKRALFLKSKYDNNEELTAAEIADLQKFNKLLK